jgi:pyruvate,orthophosphate dikinase
MVPLIGIDKEFDFLKEIIDSKARKIFKELNQTVDYKVGSMIEIPRACLIADKIADKADFFSFGTNDLTQMTFGFSRDDAGSFMLEYLRKKILDQDPFQILDQCGVGEDFVFAIIWIMYPVLLIGFLLPGWLWLRQV